ncbi:DUF2510 domain-containing protein, partial [Streptomyces sp. NPDC059096]|uniref:DUF2510 domain-containing protein n=1 Tax=Streptomyces sp. NPDC059096 TaxID=3346727 RepID=UPI0036C0E177
MTYSTPPGWHPDPGHTGDGPRQERWWDGSAWTDELRATPTGQWDPPAAPPYPLAPPSVPRNNGRRIVVGATAVVVALALAGGFYLLGRDGGNNDAVDRSGSGPAPSTAPSQPGQDAPDPDGRGGPDGGESGAPGQPQTEDGYATDGASGISLPVPDGWTGESGPVGAGVTTGSYECPGDTSQSCVRGGVFSVPAAALKITATSAKAAAEQDIGTNAEESYGGTTYGKISSHQQLKSEAVTVAGQKGYLVRWKVVTSKGDDGYVQSLAFPTPSAPAILVLVRSGIDVNEKAPENTVKEE